MKGTDWLIGILIVLFFAVSIGIYAHAKSDCDRKGGELVRKATGFYACAKVIK